MRFILTLVCIIGICASSYSQGIKEEPRNQAQFQACAYAYITVENKGLSKKLKVDVDLGDTPEQVKAGKEYSEILTNKKSYSAVLNYMAENHFELVESRDISVSYQGTGGTSGVIFIMRRAK